jgi:hypothetical protein
MTDEQAKTWDEIVARCWDDESFTKRLQADPMATLAAEGVRIPDGVTVRVVVESATERALVVPPPPDGALTDDQLSGVHGGWFFPVVCGAYDDNPG